MYINIKKDDVQNIFTAYLCTAVTRAKQRYIAKGRKCEIYELPLDAAEYGPNFEASADMDQNLPLLQQLQNEKLHAALKELNDRSLIILLTKVTSDLTFAEIAQKVNLKPKHVSRIYYSALEKIRNEIGDMNNDF